MNEEPTIDISPYAFPWQPLQPLITKPIVYKTFKSTNDDGADITVCLVDCGEDDESVVKGLIQLAHAILPGFTIDSDGLINDETDELDNAACYKLMVSMYGTYMSENASNFLRQYFDTTGTQSHDLLD